MPCSSSLEPVWAMDLAITDGCPASFAVAQAETGLMAANLAAGPKIHEGMPGICSQAGFKPITCACARLDCCKTMCAAMAAPAEWPAMTAGVRFICSSRARKPSAMPCKDRLSLAPRLVNAWPGKSGAMTSKKGLSKGSRPRQLKLPEPVPCKSKRQGP